MLKLATPISHIIKDETLATPITNITDCYEVRDHTLVSNLPNQFLYHCDMQPIHRMKEEDFEHLRYVRKSKPNLKLVTFHCASVCDEPILNGKVWNLGGKTYTADEMVTCSKENFKKIREIFGPNVEIAIENNNYYKTEAYAIVCNPEFITRVVHENNLRLLVDVAHAQISAFNKGIPFEKYFNSLPLEKVIQIHICKPALDQNGNMYDAHQLPSDFEIKLASELKEKYNPEYLTLEYYRSIEEVAECLTLLKEKLA